MKEAKAKTNPANNDGVAATAEEAGAGAGAGDSVANELPTQKEKTIATTTKKKKATN